MAHARLFARRWAEVGGNAPPTFANSVFSPLAVKAKQAMKFFFEKSDQKKIPSALTGFNAHMLTDLHIHIFTCLHVYMFACLHARKLTGSQIHIFTFGFVPF